MSNYPAIPEPNLDPQALLSSVQALKQAVEMLTGQRNGVGQALTADDQPELHPVAYTGDVTASLEKTIKLVGDADYTILPTEDIIYTNASLTAARTWTLPAASSRRPDQELLIFDRGGFVTASNNLTVQRAGSDTINNAGTSFPIFTSPTGLRLVSDGVSKWSLEFLASGVTTILDRINNGAPSRGMIPLRGASGWIELAPGTSGHVLTSNGAGADPTYQAVASGGLTRLGAAAASSGATVSFTNIPACKALFVFMKNLSHNNGANQTPRFALSTNNGSSYNTPNSIIPLALGGGATVSGVLIIGRMDQTSNFVFMGNLAASVVGGVDTVTSGTPNAIQFSWSAGNFDDAGGAIDVYYA